MRDVTSTFSSFVGPVLRLPKHSSAKVAILRRRSFSRCFRTATTPEILTALHPNSISTLIGATIGLRPSSPRPVICACGPSANSDTALEVRLIGHSEPDLLALSFSRFDPEPDFHAVRLRALLNTNAPLRLNGPPHKIAGYPAVQLRRRCAAYRPIHRIPNPRINVRLRKTAAVTSDDRPRSRILRIPSPGEPKTTLELPPLRRSSMRSIEELGPIARQISSDRELLRRFAEVMGSEDEDRARAMVDEVRRVAQALDPSISYAEGASVSLALMEIVRDRSESS